MGKVPLLFIKCLLLQMSFTLVLLLKTFVIKFKTQFVIKFNFESISIVIFLYVMYYALLIQ
jgi:hypothetical protein